MGFGNQSALGNDLTGLARIIVAMFFFGLSTHSRCILSWESTSPPLRPP